MFVLTDEELIKIIEKTAELQPAGYDYVSLGYMEETANLYYEHCNAEILEFHIRKLEKEGVITAKYCDGILIGVNVH